MTSKEMKHEETRQLLSMLKEHSVLWHLKELRSLQKTEIYEVFSK